jgi:hypothetical protein
MAIAQPHSYQSPERPTKQLYHAVLVLALENTFRTNLPSVVRSFYAPFQGAASGNLHQVRDSLLDSRPYSQSLFRLSSNSISVLHSTQHAAQGMCRRFLTTPYSHPFFSEFPLDSFLFLFIALGMLLKACAAVARPFFIPTPSPQGSQGSSPRSFKALSMLLKASKGVA